jgi:hypothetical protein
MDILKKTFLIIGISIIPMFSYADDNHVHVEQVNGGDNTDLQIDQIGYNNLTRFSFDHQNNTIDLLMIMILDFIYGVITTKLFLVKDMKSTTHLHLLGVMTERSLVETM